MLDIIISEIKQAKYYSVSVGSTPNITNVDQLTIIFRYALPDGPVQRFVKFIPTHEHIGHQLADLLFEFIEDNGINLKDLRGQSYDNASNMSGKYKGMQVIIKERNHQAKYIPCVAHSLNCCLGKCDAECCQSAVRFFMFVQGPHVFFSASTHRWNLLTDALKPLQCPTIKPLSNTSWEARYYTLHQGSPTQCPRATRRPQDPFKAPAKHAPKIALLHKQILSFLLCEDNFSLLSMMP